MTELIRKAISRINQVDHANHLSWFLNQIVAIRRDVMLVHITALGHNKCPWTAHSPCAISQHHLAIEEGIYVIRMCINPKNAQTEVNGARYLLSCIFTLRKPQSKKIFRRFWKQKRRERGVQIQGWRTVAAIRRAYVVISSHQAKTKPRIAQSPCAIFPASLGSKKQ